MTRLSLLLALLFSLSAFAGEQAEDKHFLRGAPVEDISRFSGLNTQILGPLETPIPESFFNTPYEEAIKNNANYVASFTLDAARESQSRLYLVNEIHVEGLYPVVVAITRPDGTFRNFIAQFDEFNGDLALDLDPVIARFAAESTSQREGTVFKVDIVAGRPISGSRYQGSRAVGDLEFSEPFTAKIFGEYCCGMQPQARWGRISCRIRKTRPSNSLPVVHAFYYFRTSNDPGYCPPGVICKRSKLAVDYPTVGNAFHKSSRSAACKTMNTGTCSTIANFHQTQTYAPHKCDYGNGNIEEVTMRHVWEQMVDLSTGGSWRAIAVGLASCQMGHEWEIY